MNKKKLAALVINWNGAEDTIELLRSLCACKSDGLSITAAVIDNNSVQRERATVEAGIAEIREHIDVLFRPNSINIGIPAAYNQAIQMVGLDYDYYLRLDNDVVVVPKGLASMVEALEQGTTRCIGIVGGNVKYFDRQTENNGGAVSIDLIKGKTTVTYPPSDVVCDGVLGCIMLVAGKLVREYAPEVFQASLFMCTDESELSLRAARDGVRTMYLAKSIGFHKSGRSTGKVRFVSNYYSARNWTLLRLKYVTSGRQRLSVLARIPIDIARSFVRARWAFPLGAVAGVGLTLSSFLDHRVRRGQC